jgi:adenosylhomocysteine nucleosidase
MKPDFGPAPAVLVCFALAEEAAPLGRLAGTRAGLTILVTGMGRRNSERALRAALAGALPSIILTCGLAGGLDPALKTGEVVFSCDESSGLKPALLAAGGREAHFHCADRIMVTATEKARLRQATGADAVEMESEVIRRLAAERGVPAATARVISDRADENLPLDFNLLLDADQNLSRSKLARAILACPRCLPGLLRLRRQTRFATRQLARVLARVLWQEETPEPQLSSGMRRSPHP